MTNPHEIGDEGLVEDATREEEEREAWAAHQADRWPTDEEERLAERYSLDPDVAEHEREMMKRGAEVKGEGHIP